MMRQPFIALISSLMLLTLAGCKTSHTTEQHPEPCSENWYPWVESVLSSSDGRGHGPDIGSDEWQSVIEFKLGIRGQADIPPRSSNTWCQFIDQRIAEGLVYDPIKSSLGNTKSSPETGISP
jgi:hypothetical protein